MGEDFSETSECADTEDDPLKQAVNLVDISGYWRGQILHAGVELGIFETVGKEYRSVEEVAEELDLNPAHLYRLLRALAQYGVLSEDEARRFRLTRVGEYFRADHTESVRNLVHFFQGPEYHTAWQQLPEIVAEGGPPGFERAFGSDLFDYLDQNPALSRAFNGAMTRRTKRVAEAVLDVLDGYDFGRFSHVCDVGGGHGYLLSHVLCEYPHLEGTVLDLPSVVEESDAHWARTLGVSDRCAYVAGDMFEGVPAADVYFMKSILHDWADEDCVEILTTTRASASSGAQLFVIERIVPGPDTRHAAKSSDINMMVSTGGRERTAAEYERLFEAASWELTNIRALSSSSRSIIEAKAV